MTNKDKKSAPGRALAVNPINASEKKRILFIGFGKIPGFHYFDWEDKNWANASDYESVFINCGTLTKLLSNWEQVFPDAINQVNQASWIKKQFKSLQRQLSNLLRNKNSIYVFAAPPRYYPDYPLGSFHSQVGISTYDWCPILVDFVEDIPGEAVKNKDARFKEYSKQIIRWFFYFDTQTVRPNFGEKINLAPFEELYLEDHTLFESIAGTSLGIELKYSIRDINKSYLVSFESGSLFLLQYPFGGDLMIALRSLLNEFFDEDIIETETPEWIHEINPPFGERIDIRLAEIKSDIARLTKEKEELINRRRENEKWLRLLYEFGEELENIVLESLTLLGLENVRKGPKDTYDIVGELDGETLLFEIKGLKGAVGRVHINALNRHIDEFESKYTNIEVAKGILIANAYRHLPPSNREIDQMFNGDAVKIAVYELFDFALLDTRLLFEVVKNLLESESENNLQFLRDLRNTTGIFNLS